MDNILVGKRIHRECQLAIIKEWYLKTIIIFYLLHPVAIYWIDQDNQKDYQVRHVNVSLIFLLDELP